MKSAHFTLAFFGSSKVCQTSRHTHWPKTQNKTTECIYVISLTCPEFKYLVRKSFIYGCDKSKTHQLNVSEFWAYIEVDDQGKKQQSKQTLLCINVSMKLPCCLTYLLKRSCDDSGLWRCDDTFPSLGNQVILLFVKDMLDMGFGVFWSKS